MIAVSIGIVALVAVIGMCAVRIFVGPDDANRAVASDLLFFAVVGLFALCGVLLGIREIFDVVLVATIVGFLASISLARAITRGRR